MESRRAKVLLVGENPQGFSYLANRLHTQGCECQFAASYQQACSLLTAQDFDLVLSPMRLRNGSLFPLMNLLDGSAITLFYSHPVEDGCWWLPALRHGQNCFGSSALRPSEFVAVLDKAIQDIHLSAMAEKKSAQSHVPRIPTVLVTPPSSSGESSLVEPVRIKKSRVVAA
jgi:CheY-like chemotaxis protein